MTIFLQQHTTQYSYGWLFLLAVFCCSFAAAIVKKVNDSAAYTDPWLFFASCISEISHRLVLVERPSPQPSPRGRGEGARLGIIAMSLWRPVDFRPGASGTARG
jgi:hypothetical protein